MSENQKNKKNDPVYYAERSAQLAAEFSSSYSEFQIVRRELFAHTKIPSVTIRLDSITFNTACIDGLEDTVYIQLLISRNQKRIAIRRCNENDKDALRWCIEKPDKRKSRKITSKDFSKMVYDMMGWDIHCRYKFTGYQIEYRGTILYVFDLKEPEIFHEAPRRTKEEADALKEKMSEEGYEELRRKELADSRKPFYPDDVENTFGIPVSEHKNQIRLDEPGSYQGMSQMGERAGDINEPPA